VSSWSKRSRLLQRLLLPNETPVDWLQAIAVVVDDLWLEDETGPTIVTKDNRLDLSAVSACLI